MDIAAALGVGRDYAIAVAEGGSFGRVAVVVPQGFDATTAAAGLANLPVTPEDDGAEAVSGRLAAGVRRASALRNQTTLIAAAFAWQGRGASSGRCVPTFRSASVSRAGAS